MISLALLFSRERVQSRDSVLCMHSVVRSLFTKADTLSDVEGTNPKRGKSLSLHCMKAFICLGRIACPSPFSLSLSLLPWCPALPFASQGSFCQFSFYDLFEKVTKMVLKNRMYSLISGMSSFLLWLLTTHPFDSGACVSLESWRANEALVS